MVRSNTQARDSDADKQNVGLEEEIQAMIS